MNLTAALPLIWAPEVRAARDAAAPIVAVETVALCAGVSPSRQYGFAQEAGARARAQGVQLAWLALVDGAIRIGLDDAALAALLSPAKARKLAARDLGLAVVRGDSGAMTVSAALSVARLADLSLVVTGGIGGVHSGGGDVSSDLEFLSRSGVNLVSAGIKPFLDMAATCERLDSLGVPIFGWRCDHVPALYSADSSIAATARFDKADRLAETLRMHNRITGAGALVVTGLPADSSIPRALLDGWIDEALAAAFQKGAAAHGSAATPVIVAELARLSDGATTVANEAAFTAAIDTAILLAAVAGKSRQP